MNIALVIEQQFAPNAGGVQRTTSKLVEIFNDYGHRSIIISLSLDNQVDAYRGTKIYNLPEKDRLEQINKVLNKHSIDVCINQAGYSLSITRMLLDAKPTSTRLVNTLRINPLNFYTNHRFIISNYLKRKKLHPIDIWPTHKLILLYHIIKQRFELNFIVKNVDAFVLLSDRFKAELFQLVPAVKKYRDKIFGISNPFKMPTEHYTVYDKSNIVLYVGRLELDQKRVDLLIQIWCKLHDALKEWEFWVVGEGDQEDYLKAFCKEHNLARVKFFGKRKPDDYYKKAKIFHLTSAFEGFGNVLIESQSFGCVPLLFDSYSAASEIINHAEDGYLIMPFDLDEYANYTIQLAENGAEWERMSKNAFSNAKKFSYEMAYEKWQIVFEKVNRIND